jgi:UDP-N-acetylglucosamine acyltransferase
MTAGVHPTAIVHPKAELGESVTIGPYAIIGEHVRIGRGTRIDPHVVIEGWTEIGENCQIHSFVSLGASPQHLNYKGEETHVRIGSHNILREYVTINRATVFGGGVTSIGDHNVLMAYVHIAHDCHVGSHVVMANAATLAGHITIGDHAIVGGLVGIHQFVRIGDYSMIGGCSAVGQDVPPFMRAAGGYRARLFGVNTIGLKRHGFSDDRIRLLKRVYQALFRSDLRLAEASKKVRDDFGESRDVQEVLAFLDGTKRGVCKGSDEREEE